MERVYKGFKGTMQVIFGKDNSKGIVAAEVIDGYVVCLTNTDEQIHFPMIYWVLTPFPTKNSKPLEGKQHYKHITKFTDKESYQKFLGLARKKRVDFYTVYNEIEMAMLYHGFTYYKDIKIEEVSVLAFDIEASGLARNETSTTFVITNTFRDRKGNVSKKQFRLDHYQNQQLMIKEWCQWVEEVDPDILTGHNINGYDLPYLDHCSEDGLTIGRDGSAIKFKQRPSNYRVDGSQTWEYNKAKCYGRCIVDGMFLAVKHDIGRNYPSWGLKAIADYEGWVSEDRQFYDASQIGRNWHIPEEREKIIKYCVDDSDDSLRVFDLMAPSFFYMCQSIPKPFQIVTESASGSWLNLIMVRSYLQEGHSIPKANEPERVYGGVSFGVPGNYKNVFKIDIKSMYPSIIRGYGLYPENKDPNKNYLTLANVFTEERFRNKKLYKETGEKYYDDMQASYKILINSLYGMMGASGLNFNNYQLADKITGIARQIIKFTIKWASSENIEHWWPEYDNTKDIKYEEIL